MSINTNSVGVENWSAELDRDVSEDERNPFAGYHVACFVCSADFDS